MKKKLKERQARCGACGTERLVTTWMKRDFDSQFVSRPGEEMDEFYCGCQNDPDEPNLEP